MRAELFLLLALSMALGGCYKTTNEHVAESDLKPRDKRLLANPPYAKVDIPVEFRAQEVAYHRKEVAGTILVDTDARQLYYVLPGGRALRYGVTVGEEALAFSGVAKVGRKAEWPSWTPTPSIKKRLVDIPDFVGPGPHNPMGARGIYLYQDGKDTLYRIHGTNQPEHIGQAISSGCIRMTNEDIIDLFEKIRVGSAVVVLPPAASPAPQLVASTERLGG